VQNPVYLQKIEQYLRGPSWNCSRKDLLDESGGADVLALMKEKYNFEITFSNVYNTLKRADLVWIKGPLIHPKANVEVQESFKKNSEKK
jgi:hypothetical protein